MAANDIPELTPKQRRAILALLTERTHEDAAKVAGIAERTMARWLKLPAFVSGLREAEAEMVGAAIRRMSGALGKGVDVLLDGMDAKNVKGEAEHPIRLRAADVLFARQAPLKEWHDLTERIAALEARKDE